MTNYKWIFFDVGSTLVNEELAYQDRINKAITGSNIDYDSFYRRMLSLFKEGKKGDLAALSEFGLKCPQWNPNLEVLYPETKTVLKDLHKHYQIGIIANQILGLEDRLKTFGIRQWIDLIISSAEIGLSKPDPAIFKLALAKTGCLPHQAVMIGDRLS